MFLILKETIDSQSVKSKFGSCLQLLMSFQSLKTCFTVLNFWRFFLIFFIARKLLLLSGLNVKDWASETFFSVDRTSIRISLWISICYFWFLKTLLTHLFSSSRHSLFITVVQILWAKQNSMFFKQDFRWFESNGTHLFESVSLK